MRGGGDAVAVDGYPLEIRGIGDLYLYPPHPGKTETKPYECRYSILQAALKLWGIFTHV